MRKEIHKELGICFYDDGIILLTRCPKCGSENYAINVPTGICTWCGYNAHEDTALRERIKANARPQDTNQ